MALREIRVELVSARDVKKPTFFSKIYPVAVVTLPGLSRATHTTRRPDTSDDDPRWNETFVFNVLPSTLHQGSMVNVKVYGDKDLKWYCGQASIPFLRLTKTEPQRYPLVDDTGGQRGYVKVAVTVTKTDCPAAAADAAKHAIAPHSASMGPLSAAAVAAAVDAASPGSMFPHSASAPGAIQHPAVMQKV